MAERGQDFAVYERVTAVTTAGGEVRYQTDRFTLLENGLHYFEGGAWKESEDVIEVFPDGAIARWGPNKAIFSPDLNAEAVFDLEASDGRRLRGGVRAIQLTNMKTGQTTVLATVRETAPGELLPPDRLVWRDAFDGLTADVVIVWRHNLFSHDVVLRERPALPPGWDPASVRLEVITELVECPQPEVRVQFVGREGEEKLEDHVVIDFGALVMLMGHGFAVEGERAWALGGPADTPGAKPVLKQYHELPDGRRFLVESIAWADAEPGLRDLPAAARAEASVRRPPATSPDDSAVARVPDHGNSSAALAAMAEAARQSESAGEPHVVPPGPCRWPEPRPWTTERRPIALARAPYEARGYVVDFWIVADQGQPTTLASGQTYYIRTSYYSGASVTFQPGCTIKFKNNAYLLLYGPVSFPDTLQTPVFTSRNDDGFGEKIVGVVGEPDSDGNPASHQAAQAVWIYYVNFGTTIRNARIRWAQQGVRYDSNAGLSLTHTLQDTLLEHCATGVYANLQDDVLLVLSNVKKHAVTTAITCPGGYCPNISGTITEAKFYADKSFAGFSNSPEDLELGGGVADTMGAAGPTHFVELLNPKVAVFNKSTGIREDEQTSADFFGRPQPFDPRILYDPLANRWVACAADKDSPKVILAVSLNSSPTPLLNNWLKYELDIPQIGPDNRPDYPTLGLDANGIYISVIHSHFEGVVNVLDGHVVVAVKKADAYAGTLTKTTFTMTAAELNAWAIQPAVNFNSAPTGGYAWFVAKDLPTGQGGGYHPGYLRWRRLYWSGNTAVWADSSWQTIGTVPVRYFALESAPKFAPALGAGTGQGVDLYLGNTGSRLMMATIQGSSLWTCHHVGLDGTDGDYDGTETGASVDRSAIQWWKLTVSGSGLSYGASGRVYDNAASQPYWFYFPSLAVNPAGDMVLGFSGSKATEYIGAFWLGRLANSSFPERVTLVQAGRGPWAVGQRSRVGDYSATTLEPGGAAFWTVQQYGDDFGLGAGPDYWGTWIAAVKVNP